MSTVLEIESRLHREIGAFRFDPLGYVMYAFPWGIEGTPLAREKGPERWQEDILIALGDGVHDGGEAVRCAVAHRAFDFVAEPGVIDDDVADAGRGQARQMPDDQRLAADRQHGLGQAVGQRAHAFAAARGKNHGAHQNVYPTLTWRSSRRSSRRSSGVKTP